jgi:hypothetical protein
MRTHNTQVSFRFDPAMRAELESIKRRDGIPVSEQLRRAVQLWIASKRQTAVAGRKRHRA